MKAKSKELLKNTALFAVSSFAPKFLGFFLVPLYTAFLTTSEYGTFDLVNVAVSLAFPLLSLTIRDAILRFCLDKQYQRKDCLNIALRIMGMDALILMALSAIQLVFRPLPITSELMVFFSILSLLHIASDIFCAYCKGSDRVKIIVTSSIVNTFSTLAFSFLFVAVLHMGLTGVLLSTTIGQILANATLLIFGRLFEDFSRTYSRPQMKEMLKYSAPIVLSAIAWWINNASDRYIIAAFLGVSASGIYAVSSKIPTVLASLQNVFMQAWSISAIKEYDKDDKDGFIGNTYSILSGLLCLASSAIIVANIPIASLLFKGEFFVAWKNIPLLCFAATADALALFIGNLFFAVKDTKARLWSTIVGAVINTGLNLLLIPSIGIIGAALATAAGYFAGFVTSRIMIKKYINISTNFHIHDFCLFLLFCQALLAYYGNKFILVQLLLFVALSILNRKTIKTILRAILSRLGFIKRRQH